MPFVRDRARIPCPAEARRTLAFMRFEQSFNPLNQLLSLEPPVPLPASVRPSTRSSFATVCEGPS